MSDGRIYPSICDALTSLSNVKAAARISYGYDKCINIRKIINGLKLHLTTSFTLTEERGWDDLSPEGYKRLLANVNHIIYLLRQNDIENIIISIRQGINNLHCHSNMETDNKGNYMVLIIAAVLIMSLLEKQWEQKPCQLRLEEGSDTYEDLTCQDVLNVPSIYTHMRKSLKHETFDNAQQLYSAYKCMHNIIEVNLYEHGGKFWRNYPEPLYNLSNWTLQHLRNIAACGSMEDLLALLHVIQPMPHFGCFEVKREKEAHMILAEAAILQMTMRL